MYVSIVVLVLTKALVTGEYLVYSNINQQHNKQAGKRERENIHFLFLLCNFGMKIMSHQQDTHQLMSLFPHQQKVSSGLIIIIFTDNV